MYYSKKSPANLITGLNAAEIWLQLVYAWLGLALVLGLAFGADPHCHHTTTIKLETKASSHEGQCIRDGKEPSFNGFGSVRVL